MAHRMGLTMVLTAVALALLLGLPSRRWARWLGGGLVALAVVTMLFGAAIVPGRFATSLQYNRHDVIGYRVLIGTADRRVVAGEFRTDGLGVRDLGDLSIYPEAGDVFTVRYLSRHPQDFMLRNDDQSSWSRKLACARLDTWTADALRQAGAAPENAEFQRGAARAMASARDAGCQ